MRYDNLESLVAEMRAMELWDRGEKPAQQDDVEARRLRRLEILGEIDAMLREQAVREALLPGTAAGMLAKVRNHNPT